MRNCQESGDQFDHRFSPASGNCATKYLEFYAQSPLRLPSPNLRKNGTYRILCRASGQTGKLCCRLS